MKPGCPHANFPVITRQLHSESRYDSKKSHTNEGGTVTEYQLIGWRVTKQDVCSRCGFPLGPSYVVEEPA